jgi:hypothetical protein
LAFSADVFNNMLSVSFKTLKWDIAAKAYRPEQPVNFKYRKRNLYSKPLKFYDICIKLILGPLDIKRLQSSKFGPETIGTGMHRKV